MCMVAWLKELDHPIQALDFVLVRLFYGSELSMVFLLPGQQPFLLRGRLLLFGRPITYELTALGR